MNSIRFFIILFLLSSFSCEKKMEESAINNNLRSENVSKVNGVSNQKEPFVPEVVSKNISNKNTKSNFDPSSELTSEIFRTDSLGWGYKIFMNGKMYIYQPTIPAITGNKGFVTENDARVISGLIIKKIRNNIIPPSMSIQELDSLGVLK